MTTGSFIFLGSKNPDLNLHLSRLHPGRGTPPNFIIVMKVMNKLLWTMTMVMKASKPFSWGWRGSVMQNLGLEKEHWAGLAQRINKPFLPIRHMGAMPIITKGLACMSLQAQGKTIGSTLDMIHFQHIEPTSGKSRFIASKQIHSPYLANAILATAVATVWAVLLTIS